MYSKVPRSEAFQHTGKPPITVKWVDVNKGDDQEPNYRSRLVAREIRKKWEDSIFAPTPPLEALRAILSATATKGTWSNRQWHATPESEERLQISLIDISRAYFNARTSEDHPVYVELPPEDPDYGKSLCGKLNVHMYGTRPAADGWHCEYSQTLTHMGFEVGQSSACLFWHKERNILTSVHSDDFTTAGSKKNLDWLKQQLRSKYELKEGARLGAGVEDDKEGRVLNRVVRWTPQGTTYEADPRQHEKLIAELGLEGARSVSTPVVRPSPSALAEDCELEAKKTTHFRGLAARCNYLAADRPDCAYAAKEICRWMSAPTDLGLQGLKRMARYLVGSPRLVWHYRWQDVQNFDVYSDTDWAGCPKTRKSTSGGCVMVGTHLIKAWSSTQPNIALSSGEAQVVGVTRACAIALGFRSLLSDLGIRKTAGRVWTDSSAAIGICKRQGLGKLRHLDTQMLWVQQRVRNNDLDL